MTNVLIIFQVSLVVASIAGLLMAWRQKSLAAYERALIAMIPASGVVVAMVFMVDISIGFFRPWNNARLAPTEAWLHGYATYYIDDGPILGTMYTPLSYWFYLPAVLFPTPYAAVFAGLILALIYTLVPGLVFIALVCRQRGLPAIWPVGLGILYVLIHFLERGLLVKGIWIHVDQPAQALLVIGLSIIYLMGPCPRWWVVFAAAGCIVLTPWCKQTYFPFVAAMPVVVWLLYGRALSFRFLIATAATGLFSCLVAAATLEFRAMWFNAVALPQAQPWNVHGWMIIVMGFLVTASSASLALCLIGGLMAAQRLGGPGRTESAPLWFERHRWTILFVPILFSTPVAFVGLVKNGSNWNHIAPISLLILLGAMLYVIDRVCEVRKSGILSYSAATTVVLPLAFLAIVGGLSYQSRAKGVNLAWQGYFANPEIQAFMISKSSPRQIYFPFHPLTTLKSEDQAYHLSDGIVNRMMADIPVSKSQFAQGLPENMSVIAIYTGDDPITEFLPEFSEKVTVAQLPGWVFYKKPTVAATKPGLQH